MKTILLLVCLMYTCSLYSFIANRSHLLLSLLSLEYMIMVTSFMFLYVLFLASLDFYLLLFFLVLSVSESAIGLSLLVASVRVHGNDMVLSLGILW